MFNDKGHFPYSWRLRDAKIAASASKTYLTIDVVFHHDQQSKYWQSQDYLPGDIGLSQTPRQDGTRSSKQSARATEFLLSMARKTQEQPSEKESGVKLLLSLQSGYVVRSDFLLQRLTFCKSVDFVVSFLEPTDHVHAYLPGLSQHVHLHEILEFVVGAVVVQQDQSGSMGDKMEAMDRMLSDRLSCTWIVPSPLRHPRLILVGCRPPIVMERWLASAFHMGLRLTVVGAQGQWLQQADAPDVIEQYIPIDMSPDFGLSNRVVQALSGDKQGFDGICTFTDACFIATAEAAKRLGLRTAPLESVQTSTDKHLTQAKNQGNAEAIRVTGVSDLETQLRSTKEPLIYPVIAKPCFGWGSNGVYLVSDHDELTSAVSKLADAYNGIDIMIETYERGPEIDANFVLQGGKILFFELVDGFPCTAEIGSGIDKSKDFLETDMVWPSAHPLSEQVMIRSAFHKTLLRAGFRTGIYHVEGRIRNSALSYLEEDGYLDIRLHGQTNTKAPEAFLLEINQRPPGSGATWVTALNFGVDYTALHLLAALEEPERFSALSEQFLSGPQRHCVMVYINSHKGGVLKTGDALAELRALRPALITYIDYHCWFFPQGSTIPDNPVKLGMFLISSDTRERALRLAQSLRRDFHARIE